jgi:hypothetical protein
MLSPLHLCFDAVQLPCNPPDGTAVVQLPPPSALFFLAYAPTKRIAGHLHRAVKFVVHDFLALQLEMSVYHLDGKILIYLQKIAVFQVDAARQLACRKFRAGFHENFAAYFKHISTFQTPKIGFVSLNITNLHHFHPITTAVQTARHTLMNSQTSIA